MKHKHLKHLFTALLLLCTTFASAHDFEVGGIYYNILSEEDKTVEVTSGTNRYTGSVVITESVTYNGTTYSVTSIGYRAFSYCDGLTSVVIGNSVTSIGEDAFRKCSGLTSIVIGNSVTSIGKNAFYDCSGLTSIEIPNSVTGIGGYAFSGCSGLKKVCINDLAAWCGIDFGTSDANPLYYAKNLYLNDELVTKLVIPECVKKIKKYAFRKCSGLTSIEIPNSVTSIADRAFNGCSGLKEVHISDLTAFCNIDFGVAHDLFFYAKKMYLNGELVTELVIPEGVTEIKNYAFNYCRSLTSIVIPNSVTSIGSEAFSGCYDLINVVIGNSVTSIGKDAFRSCSSLKEVHINNLSTWCNIDFGSNEANPLYHVGSLYLNDELLTELVIPEDVKKVKSNAFFYCYGLTNVVIGNNVTCISQGAFNYCYGLNNVVIGNSVTDIEHGAFFDCENLTSISVESGNTIYDSRENCNAIIETETNTLIAGCENTIIPNSVTSIGRSAFEVCPSLTSITIPNSVTSIGDWAFSGCTGLASIEIPNSVTSIGEGAFSDCI